MAAKSSVPAGRHEATVEEGSSRASPVGGGSVAKTQIRADIEQRIGAVHRDEISGVLAESLSEGVVLQSALGPASDRGYGFETCCPPN